MVVKRVPVDATFIDDVLDDNFTDWVGIRNRIDLDNALADADFYEFEGK